MHCVTLFTWYVHVTSLWFIMMILMVMWTFIWWLQTCVLSKSTFTRDLQCTCPFQPPWILRIERGFQRVVCRGWRWLAVAFAYGDLDVGGNGTCPWLEVTRSSNRSSWMVNDGSTVTARPWAGAWAGIAPVCRKRDSLRKLVILHGLIYDKTVWPL